MASGHYATALTSVMDTKAGFQRLAAALEDIDHKNRFNEAGGKGEPLSSDLIYQAPKHGMAIGEAMALKTETLPLKASTGYISQEYIYLYPPGIPLVAPGEIMTGKLLRTISQCQAQGLSVEGLNDMSGKQINVVKM